MAWFYWEIELIVAVRLHFLNCKEFDREKVEFEIPEMK